MLKNESGKDIYLCGGAELDTMLFEEKLIDEVVLKLNPILSGSHFASFQKFRPDRSGTDRQQGLRKRRLARIPRRGLQRLQHADFPKSGQRPERR